MMAEKNEEILRLMMMAIFSVLRDLSPGCPFRRFVQNEIWLLLPPFHAEEQKTFQCWLSPFLKVPSPAIFCYPGPSPKGS